MSQEDLELKKAIRPSTIYPLTYLTKRSISFRQRLNNSWQNYKACKKNKTQIKGTEIIRNMMVIRHEQHLCHQKERIRKEKHKRRVILQKLKEEHNIDVKDSKMLLQVAQKLDEKTKEFKKQKNKQTERLTGIIQKLLREQKRQEQIDRERNKTYDYKVKPRQAVTVEEEEEEEVEEEDEEEEFYTNVCKDEVQIIEIEQEIKESNDKNKQIDSQETSKESDTKDKNKKDKTDTRDSGKRKPKEEEFELPIAPIVNPHEIYTGEPIEVATLINQLELDEYLHDLLKTPESSTLSCDSRIGWKLVAPNSFEPGGSWKQKIVVTNSNSDTRMFRFYKIRYNTGEELDKNVFNVEPFGTQKLIPGLSFSFNVLSRPEENSTSSECIAEIICHTFKTDGTQQMEISIPIDCSVPTTRILVQPQNLSFKPMKYWLIKRSTNTIELTNVGRLPGYVIVEIVRSSPDDSSVESEKKSEETFFKSILEECFENVFNVFHFEDYTTYVSPGQSKTLRVYQVNARHCGYYTEKFVLKTLQQNKGGEWTYVQQQVLICETNITGNLLSLDEEILDFNICILNSVYQQLITVRNMENYSMKIGFQFPTKLGEFFSVYPPTAFIPTNGKQEFNIKFVPRKTLMSNTRHFLSETNILNFQTRIIVLTKNLESTPPLLLEVYAILTKPDDVTIKPMADNSAIDINGEYLIDLDQVSTHETVKFNIEIENSSMVEQDYGFIDLPESVTVDPDYGFGQLHVGEKRKLTVNFKPTIWDIPTKFGGQDSDPAIDQPSNEVLIKLTCTTIVYEGGIKKKEYYKLHPKKARLSKSSRFATQTLLIHKNENFDKSDAEDGFYKSTELENTKSPVKSDRTSTPKSQIGSTPKTPENPNQPPTPKSPLSYKMTNPSNTTGQTINSSRLTTSNKTAVSFIPVSSSQSNPKTTAQTNPIDQKPSPDLPPISTRSILIRAVINDNWCEISHQYIDFEDTPVGSFSIMHTYFNAFNDSSINECKCGYLKSNRIENFRCHFEIFGGCEEIKIEPTCGDLTQGQFRKLTLVARPVVPSKILEERAELFKIMRLEFQKGSRGKRKGKETADTTSKRNLKDPREIYKYIPLDNSDLYAAEKELWKYLNPFEINTKFVVFVTYPDIPERAQEIMYIEAKCRVVKPLFLLNTETQSVDFGPTIMACGTRKILILENISDSLIAPKLSIPNPEGPFTCNINHDLLLESQHLLKIPLTFTPLQEKQVCTLIKINHLKNNI